MFSPLQQVPESVFGVTGRRPTPTLPYQRAGRGLGSAPERSGNALGAKPRDVLASRAPGGCFSRGLPKSYPPSTRDAKLEEVASRAVSRLGWMPRTDPDSLTATIPPAHRLRDDENVGRRYSAEETGRPPRLPQWRPEGSTSRC